MSDDHERPGALADMRVLDLTDRLGQYTSRLFAQLGADVIRVEPPGGGCARLAHPRAEGEGIERSEASLEFWFHNRGKRSVVADLDAREGRELVRRLALGVDVLSDSFRPGELAERGLDYASLAASNPRLIYTSITGFGQDGPFRDYVWSDLVLMGLGGQMWLCGYPDAPPARIYGDQSYMQGALHAAYATLIALYDRDRTGLGQHIDVSTHECVATAMETAMQFWDVRKELRVRTGAERRSPGAGPYPCADGMVQWMAAATANGWKSLVQWLQDEGVPGDYWKPEWEEASYRVEHLDEFDERFIPWLMTKTMDELAEEAARRHLTIGPMRSVDEIVRDPHLKARGFWSEIRDPHGRQAYQAPGVPFRMSATPLDPGARAPRLGEHTEVVRAELADASRAPGGRIVEREPGRRRHVLEGLRVVDFSWFGAGPMGTKVLADHGAEVIRIESEYRLDGLRRAGPMPLDRSGPNLSGYYNNHNSSKLSFRLNSNTAGGQELLRRLIATANVVIDNLNTGVMEKWGLDYERLHELKRDIIQVRMPMMGLSGPRAAEVGFGSTLTAFAGLNMLTGFENQLPVGIGTNYPDYSCNPYHAMSAILAALHHRDRTGEGQLIELAQYESTLQLLGPAFLEYEVTGRVPQRQGNADPLAAPHAAFRAGGPPTSAGEDDRWIAIACFTDEHWRALVGEMGGPEWAAERRFKTAQGRIELRDDLEGHVAAWVRRCDDAYELMDRLQARGVPAGVVQDAGDTLERDRQLEARRHFQRLVHPEAGDTAYDAPPVRLARTRGELRSPAPCLGQHNDYVLREVLGLTDDEIAGYERQEVFF
jgi:crotonobetainyl-CoA:carnitine CoA-transferase CaiB-like acyl-CoA transferase